MLKLEKEENFSGLKKKVRNFEVSTKCVDASLIFPSFSPEKLNFAWLDFPPKIMESKGFENEFSMQYDFD